MEPLGALLGPLGAVFGHVEALLGSLGALLELSWGSPGGVIVALSGFEGSLGASWSSIGACWGSLRALLGLSWGYLEASWGNIGALLGSRSSQERRELKVCVSMRRTNAQTHLPNPLARLSRIQESLKLALF